MGEWYFQGMSTDPRSDPARAWYYSVRFKTNEPVTHWPTHFVIVTGWATTGEVWTAAENKLANLRLEAELAGSGRWLAPITGYSSETGHGEPGFAVVMTPDEGTALGRRYRQDAIYVVRDGSLWVRYCGDEQEDPVAEDWQELVD